MKKYPFKFLDSYDSGDTSIFFGRDEEIKALYEMVFQNPIVLVYGASGTGKTSLIQCGLGGKFKSYDWLPLMVRRGSNINAALQKVLEDAGGNSENFDQELDDANEKELPRLAKLVRGVYLSQFKTIYLIFDQFEELFILGKKIEQETFIKSVNELLQMGQPVKILFSIREEYLGHLSEFEKAVPQLFRKKLRVEPMNLNKVRQVIVGAAGYESSNVRLRAGETEQIAKAIFDKIKGKEKSLTIQLPYLQVFLDKFYLTLTNDESRQAHAEFDMHTLNKMGDIGDVLSNFLEDQVQYITKKLSLQFANVSINMTWEMLSPFATLEGTKEPINKQELHEKLSNERNDLIDAALSAFINGRILRYTEETDQYEIAHDSLAKSIAAKRSDEEIAMLEIKRLIKSQTSLKGEARETFTEKQMIFFEPFLDKIKLSPQEQILIQQSLDAVARLKAEKKKEKDKENQRLLEKQRTQKKFIHLMVIALVLMVGIVVWALIQRGEAKKEKIIAEAEKKSADIAKAVAETAQRIAKTAEGEALKARDIAIEAKKKIRSQQKKITVNEFEIAIQKNQWAEDKKDELIDSANKKIAFGKNYEDIDKNDWAKQNYEAGNKIYRDTMPAHKKPGVILHPTNKIP